MLLYTQFINVSVFQKNWAGISSNVLGNWRFASPDKGLRSKTRAGKMWVRKAWERAAGDRPSV